MNKIERAKRIAELASNHECLTEALGELAGGKRFSIRSAMGGYGMYNYSKDAFDFLTDEDIGAINKLRARKRAIETELKAL
jgi:hypothetical protein